MAQIRFELDPARLSNPDLDIRYVLADELSTIPTSTITDDGYEYSNDAPAKLMIYLNSKSPETDVQLAIGFLTTRLLLENRVLDASIICVSDDGFNWRRVFPCE